MSAPDAVLLVGFGGPTPGCCKRRDPCPGEATCFVEGVLGFSPARAGRVAEVAAHYRHCGGFSPFNDMTYAQGKALQEVLTARGITVSVRAGFRHWAPYVQEAVAALAREGRRHILCAILAPHQSTVSWDWYLKVVGEALDPLGASVPQVSFLDPFWKEEGFVSAWADRIRETDPADDCELVFTAHAIPQALARTSPYEKQFRETAEAVAGKLGRSFDLAYQSGPGAGAAPWTGPDVVDFLHGRAAPGRAFLLAPVGFLSENMEILYDLDVAAKQEAEGKGAEFRRAKTAGSHPAFIGMLADRVAAKMEMKKGA